MRLRFFILAAFSLTLTFALPRPFWPWKHESPPLVPPLDYVFTPQDPAMLNEARHYNAQEATYRAAQQELERRVEWHAFQQENQRIAKEKAARKTLQYERKHLREGFYPDPETVAQMAHDFERAKKREERHGTQQYRTELELGGVEYQRKEAGRQANHLMSQVQAQTPQYLAETHPEFYAQRQAYYAEAPPAVPQSPPVIPFFNTPSWPTSFSQMQTPQAGHKRKRRRR